jgi:hypothetical protein
MNRHPYLRAYMAGIAVPTVFMLVIFAFFCTVRFVYRVDVLIERVIVFPLALVPNLWGVWNILYTAHHSRRRLPLGIHGALLPAILLPLALAGARTLVPEFPTYVVPAFWMILPGLLIVYYLAWKYLVGFLNGMLGIA